MRFDGSRLEFLVAALSLGLVALMIALVLTGCADIHALAKEYLPEIRFVETPPFT